MANINSQNITKAEEALQLAYKDLISFGKLFLPDDFMRSETPPFHYEVSDAIDDKSVKQLAIILPRGHGKTVLTKASILKDFVFCPKEDMLFYAWVSATQKLSVGNMDYIKYHLEFNERILYYFGSLKGRKWTEDDIELTNGCKLISKSNLSGIRGGAKLHKRYDLIILDDFEDENNTITPESRSKISNLVTAVVFPALEPKTGRLRINGTPVHYDAFIQKILIGHEKAKKENRDDYAWKVITYKALQENNPTEYFKILIESKAALGLQNIQKIDLDMFELITSKISKPKLRWASLASNLECDLNALNKAFGVPKTIQELSIIYRKLYEFTIKQGVDAGNHEILAFIEDVDALRRIKRFNKALEILDAAKSFGSLKSTEIIEDLRKQRLKVIEIELDKHG